MSWIHPPLAFELWIIGYPPAVDPLVEPEGQLNGGDRAVFHVLRVHDHQIGATLEQDIGNPHQVAIALGAWAERGTKQHS